jgi:5S rRNA maturation endonuclease (ribonuclease M5)
MDGYLLMSSPIREGDEHPSFAVFWGDKRNCWIYCDYGTGWTGSSIDLWQVVRNVDYITAIQEMRETFGINLLEQEKDVEKLKRKVRERIEKQRREQKEKRSKLRPKEGALSKVAYRILEVKERITNPKLLSYLKKRKIQRIPSWLKEIRYKHLSSGREYYGLAVQNFSGAWNVRSALEKGKYVIYENPEQKQTFSWIKRGNDNKKAVIVEGMFDALSLEQIAKRNSYDIIILNGVGNYKELIKSEVLKNYEEVILALDNDKAGKEIKKALLEYLEDEGKTVKELVFSVGKDLNECLVRGGKVEVKQLARPLYAGVIRHKLIISDDINVLKKLKATEIRRIKKEEDIKELILYSAIREVELYFGGQDIPEWITESLQEKPAMKKYWKINGELLLEDDIYQNPSLYKNSSIEEVRRLAERRISAQIQESSGKRQELRKEKPKERGKRGKSYEPELGR